MAENITDEGGYPVPDRIAIWLVRLWFIQLLADKAELGKAYFFDSNGFHYCTTEKETS